MLTIQYVWYKLLLFHLHHRAIGCVLSGLIGFWAIYLMATFICPGFWCTPIVITLLVIFVGILIWTAVISDSKKGYQAMLENVEACYDKLFPKKE